MQTVVSRLPGRQAIALSIFLVVGTLFAGALGFAVATDAFGSDASVDLADASALDSAVTSFDNQPDPVSPSGNPTADVPIDPLHADSPLWSDDETGSTGTAATPAGFGGAPHGIGAVGSTDEQDDAEATDPSLPDFQIVDADMPEDVGQAHNITVTATIENRGESGAQPLNFTAYAPQQPEDEEPPPVESVAVVDHPTNSTQGEAIVDILDDEYDTVDLVMTDDLIEEMGDYEVIVIFRFDSDPLAAAFLDELEDDQGTVYLDDHQVDIESESWADGVLRLHNVREDPGDWESVFLRLDTNPAEVTITADHPIFDNVGEVGDTVVLNEDSNTWGSFFDDYSGDVIADVDYSPSHPDEYSGPGIGVNDAENEVLLNALSYDLFSEPDDATDAGATLLTNAVAHVADAPTADESEPIRGVDAEFPFYGDVVIHVYDTVALDAGETTTVELEYEVPANLAPDRYTQELSTADDAVISELWVELQPDIEVSSYALDPDPAEENLSVGETLTAVAVVTNHGDRTGEFEVEYLVDEEVVANETVEVPAGTKTVELDHQLRESGTKIISVNGVDPVQLDVEAAVSVGDYTGADGVVDAAGLRDAVHDWRGGTIDTALLRDVVDYWRSGEPVS